MENVENLKESHEIEARAITFYRKSDMESDHPWIRLAYKNSVAICLLSDKLDTILVTLTKKSDQSADKTEGSQDRVL